MTQTSSVKIERWENRVPGGRDELNQMWRLMDAVAPEVKIPQHEVDERVKRMLKHIYPPSIFLVAEVEDIVQGLIIAEVGDTANTSHVGWLRMEVNPKHRSKGIGSKLLDTMIITATNQGLRRLEITSYQDNARARQFFLNHGFKIEGHHHQARRDPATGKYIDTYTLAMILGQDPFFATRFSVPPLV